MKEELKKIKTDDEICDYILETFSDMFDAGKFDEVADILNDFEVSDFHDTQTPVTLMAFSCAIDPLSREIPTKSKINKLHLARIKFYDKCLEYYKNDDDRDAILSWLKPENYEESVNFYKKLFLY